LGRKCSECNKPISWQYPLVELAAGLLFVLVFQQLGISLAGIFAAIIWTLLLFIYLHDGRTMMIPRFAVWTCNGLAFASLFVVLPADSLAISQMALRAPGWLEALLGPITAAPLVAIWLFSGGQAMGLGDGKLALGIGWLLGASEAASAVMLAFWIGAVVSLSLLGFQRLWKTNSQNSEKGITMKTAVPFGPFLILGLMFVYFTGITLL
jgi:leader peptidase (prepilin peptidase)/N-methyltransferase